MNTEYLILLCIAVNMAALYVIVGAKKTEANVTQKKPSPDKKTPDKIVLIDKRHASMRGPTISAQKRAVLMRAIESCAEKHSMSVSALMVRAGLSDSIFSTWKNDESGTSLSSYTKVMNTIKEIEENAASK